jgi:hypothetical protein
VLDLLQNQRLRQSHLIRKNDAPVRAGVIEAVEVFEKAEGENNMDVLTALQLPHLLMIAGALLVVAGFIGYAFRKNREAARGETDSLDPSRQALHVDNGKGKGEGEHVVSNYDELAAELSSPSASELRSYLASLEDRVLESRNPLAVNIIHAARRARDRKENETDVPFGKLLGEEMDRLNSPGGKPP